MHDAERATLRAQLVEDRAAQMAVLEDHGAELHSEVVADLGVSSSGFSDAGAQAEARSEVLAAIETARTRVHQIDEALTRMDDGGYGTCVDCGRVIPIARLEVRPLSVRCVDCASRYEDR